MRVLSTVLLTLCVSGATAVNSSAQSRHGARPLLARDAEIALARSAAPAQVSAKARIWAWTGERYVVADSGEGTVSCYVGRPWVPGTEPHCLDEEGSQSILPIQMRRVELYAQGKTEAEADRDVADGLLSGRFRLPRRPAVTYMMSQAQNLVTGNGTAVDAWQPHMMIYFPYLDAAGIGLKEFVPGVGFVENPGQALSALVIPVKSFVPASEGMK